LPIPDEMRTCGLNHFDRCVDYFGPDAISRDERHLRRWVARFAPRVAGRA